MRQIDDGLDASLERPAGDIVQHQRHRYGHDDAGDNLHTGDEDGIPDDLADRRHLEHESEILQSDPG